MLNLQRFANVEFAKAVQNIAQRGCKSIIFLCTLISVVSSHRCLLSVQRSRRTCKPTIQATSKSGASPLEAKLRNTPSLGSTPRSKTQSETRSNFSNVKTLKRALNVASRVQTHASVLQHMDQAAPGKSSTQ